MLMLLGAFQSIGDDIYEASSIDGANAIQRFFRITIPIIRPTIGLSLVISVIGSVLAFEQFKIMTAGGHPLKRRQQFIIFMKPLLDITNLDMELRCL